MCYRYKTKLVLPVNQDWPCNKKAITTKMEEGTNEMSAKIE